MQLLLQHTNLSDTAQTFFMDVLQRCPQVFRPREIHWQLKLLSRFPADRDSFVAAVEQKSHELAQVLPFLSIAPVPPPRSTPLRLWANYGLPWPDPVGLLTQLYLQQILSSADLFLDLGSKGDSFFVSEKRDSVAWVPETRGTRWHEPFRSELARLYLGWAFAQERLIDMALMSLHLTPLKRQLLQVLSHWNAEHRWCVEEGKKSLFELFDKAEQLGIYLHPNLLIWAIYELEMIEVLSVFKLQPNLEMSADELCRQQSRVSA